MSQQWLDFLRLSSKECDELLATLDAANAESGAGSKSDEHEERKSRRWQFRAELCHLTVEHPEGGAGRYLAAPRDVSTGGVAILHGGFVHPGSKAQITMKKKSGESVTCNGRVAFCHHVRGTAHLIGLAFDVRIDPTEFLIASDTSGNTTTTSVQDLFGRILWLDDDVALRSLVEYFLSATGAQVTAPAKVDDVFAPDTRLPYDMVVTELQFDGTSAIELTKRMREERSYMGPVVLMSADVHSPMIREAASIGVSEFIEKPFDRESLLRQLSRVQEKTGLTIDQDSLRSVFEGDEELTELIRSFVGSAKQIAEDVEEAVSNQDLAGVRKGCLSLKGSAPGYGFHALAEAAASTLQSLDATGSISESMPRLTKLMCMCRGTHAP